MMNTTNTTNGTNNAIGVKVSYVPGEVREFAVTLGTPVQEILDMANMSTEGYEIRMDGIQIEATRLVKAGDEAITLVKQVKGNAGTIKASYVPGEVREFAIAPGTTVAEVLEMANMDTNGYEIRLDGTQVESSEVIDGEEAITLVKQVKGNSSFSIKASYVPEEVREFAVEEGTKIADVLDMANMSTEGYEIRLDGIAEDISRELIKGDEAITLVKQVKGNKDDSYSPGRYDPYDVASK